VIGQTGDADPDQPQWTGSVPQCPVEERAGELADALAVVGPDGQRRGPRPDREVGVAQLRRHRPRDLTAVLEMLGETERLPPKLVVQTLAVAHVLRERLLVRDRDSLDRDLQPPRVDAARPVTKLAADHAGQQRAQRVVVERREVADRLDTRAGQPFFGARPDARQEPDGKRRQEGGLASRADNRQPAGLAPIGCDLRDDLGRCDAERAREVGSRAHDRADTLGDGPSVVEIGSDFLEVEVPLVDADLLHGGNDLADERPHFAGVISVQGMPRTNEGGMRATTQRFGARHRGVDPIAASDVVRGCDDAAAVRVAADDERHGAVRRLLQLLDRGKERIEVEVRNDHLRKGTVAVGLLALTVLAAGCGSERKTQAPAPRPPRPPEHKCVTGERPLGSSRRSYAAFAPNGAVAQRAPGGHVLARFGAENVNHYPTVFAVLGVVMKRDCRPVWYRVQLPMKPNGIAGYVRASSVVLRPVSTRIVVDLSQRRLTLFERGRVKLRAVVAIGSRATPTPTGHYYVNQRLVPDDVSGPFGPGAVGISAFSNVLTGWTQGGPVAIHGTNEPWSIGHAVSNGCIRLPNATLTRVFALAVAGTPVVIRA
jgi:lipoprotein-anchoring transpeptidase ErfK/SrfK